MKELVGNSQQGMLTFRINGGACPKSLRARIFQILIYLKFSNEELKWKKGEQAEKRDRTKNTRKGSLIGRQQWGSYSNLNRLAAQPFLPPRLSNEGLSFLTASAGTGVAIARSARVSWAGSIKSQGLQACPHQEPDGG